MHIHDCYCISNNVFSSMSYGYSCIVLWHWTQLKRVVFERGVHLYSVSGPSLSDGMIKLSLSCGQWGSPVENKQQCLGDVILHGVWWQNTSLLCLLASQIITQRKYQRATSLCTLSNDVTLSLCYKGSVGISLELCYLHISPSNHLASEHSSAFHSVVSGKENNQGNVFFFI